MEKVHLLKETSFGFHRGASKLSGESNEEIRSWREERKRNYPTRTNVQRKVRAAIQCRFLCEIFCMS